MRDRFGRSITYLRVSVTDRCNLACRYCAPPGGIRLLPRAGILSFEEIEEVVREAASLGVRKVRLTGGEPLVRKGIEDLVRRIAAIEGVEDLGLTTNGILLAPKAEALARAGLMRVNVSLDTLDPERYAWITRGGDLHRVLEGIDAAVAAGRAPVELSCVVERCPGGPGARSVARFAAAKGLQVRFIEKMDAAAGRFSVVRGGAGGDCPRCDRLRLTADGRIRPCLFSDLAFGVRELGAREALLRAVGEKPRAGGVCAPGRMQRIGG